MKRESTGDCPVTSWGRDEIDNAVLVVGVVAIDEYTAVLTPQSAILLPYSLVAAVGA